MAKKKKVNPRRIPVSKADVLNAQSFSLDAAWAIFFSALRDKEGFDNQQLRRVWDQVNYLSDSISKRRISVQDLAQVLEEEAGITFGKGMHRQ